MAKKRNKDYLVTKDMENAAVEAVICGGLLTQVQVLMGFRPDQKMALFKYMERNPEFRERLYRARAESCWFLEDQLMTVCEDYADDAKMARVAMEKIAKILKYRNPSVYGDRVDLNVTTVDLTGALGEARERARLVVEAPIAIDAVKASIK